MSAIVYDSYIPGTRVEYIAVLATMGLYGITCMQTFLYFMYHQRNDHWYFQLLVVYLWIMDTVHQVITNRGFWALVSRVHDPFVLSQEYLYAGLFTSLVTLPIQAFFIMRIWQFSNKHWIVPTIFIPCSLFQFGGYIAFLVICLKGGPTAEIIFVIEKLPMAFWGVQAAEDALISISLIYLIWIRRISSGFKSTDRLLFRLTIFVVNTGTWTALCALFTIITLAAYPNVQIYVALNFVICPLYCNTALANLNARGFIRGDNYSEPNEPSDRTIALSGFQAARPERSGISGFNTTSDSPTELSMPTFANNSSFRLETKDSMDKV